MRSSTNQRESEGMGVDPGTFSRDLWLGLELGFVEII